MKEKWRSMEYVDVLDENGSPTGKTKLRSEVHRDGDWHRAVHVWHEFISPPEEYQKLFAYLRESS